MVEGQQTEIPLVIDLDRSVREVPPGSGTLVLTPVLSSGQPGDPGGPGGGPGHGHGGGPNGPGCPGGGRGGSGSDPDSAQGRR